MVNNLRIFKMARNYAALASAELISKVLAALAFAYLARVLGPQQYGALEFSLAVLFLFTLMADSGLNSYGARELAKNPAAAENLIPEITLMRVVLSLVTCGSLVILAAVLNLPQQTKSMLWLYSLTLLGVPGLVQWVFQGRETMHVVAMASLLRWSLFSACVFWFVHGAEQVWMIPLIETLAVAATAVFLTGILRRTYKFPRKRVSFHRAFALLREAFPIGASELVWAVKIYFATIWLGLILGGEQVGWFSSAHRIVISLHAFVWLYFYNLLPSIARESLKPSDSFQQLMRTSLQFTSWAAVFLGLFGSAFARPALLLLYGDAFQKGVPVFQVLIWLIPLTLLSGHFRYTLIGYNRQRLEFAAAAIGAAANILLNLLLIPRFGVLGAAWALVLSELAIWAAAIVFVGRSITTIPWLRHLALPILSGALAYAVLHFFLPLGGILAAGSGAAALYGLSALVTLPRLRKLYN